MSQKPDWITSNNVTKRHWRNTRGRVCAGPSFQLGTLSTHIANLLGACDFRDSTKVPVSHDLWPWPWPWAHRACRLTWGPSSASFMAIRSLPASALGIIAQTERQTDTTYHEPFFQNPAKSWELGNSVNVHGADVTTKRLLFVCLYVCNTETTLCFSIYKRCRNPQKISDK